MRLYIAVAVLCACVMLLSGCSGLVKQAEVSSTLVLWQRKVPTGCGNAVGCAFRTQNFENCVIQMPEDSPDWVIAHEFRHCFGYEHY
jgi:hypothetical protein